MFLPSLLRGFLLAFFLVPWTSFTTNAAPVPVITRHTRFASTQHPDHKKLVHAAKDESNAAQPRTVHLHPVPNEYHHVMGTVGVDKHHKDGMSEASLHAHIDKAKETLRKSHPNTDFEIHAHHTPGEAHVMFHAAPAHHFADIRPVANTHAIRHPGASPSDSPHHRLLPHDRDFITNSLHHKVFSDPHHPRFTAQPVPGTEGVHHEGRHGTLPLAHPDMARGMSAAQLQMHAEWINKHLTGGKDDHHIHVSHTPGNDHIKYHFVPAQHGVSDAEVRSHIQDMGTKSFKAQAVSSSGSGGPNNHGYMWRGQIPAHTTGKMPESHVRIYAQQAREETIKAHKLTGEDATGMVIAASHKDGDDKVQYASQAKGSAVFKLGKGSNSPHIDRALKSANHYTPDGKLLANHAETMALRASLREKGVTEHTSAEEFASHMKGHVIGVAGAGDRPCYGCHRTLSQFPGVEYRDMNRGG